MSDSSFDLHVLTPSSPALDLACVASLKAGIEAAQLKGSRQIALDLSKIAGQTPQGLAALVEIGLAFPSVQIAICGLSRAFLVCAIDLGIAELFPIYVSTEAFQSALQEHEAYPAEQEPCAP